MLNIIDIIAHNPETKETAFCLQVSTREQLPTLGAQIGLDKVGAGTIAQVIQEDVFVTLDETGDYFPPAYTPEE